VKLISSVVEFSSECIRGVCCGYKWEAERFGDVSDDNHMTSDYCHRLEMSHSQACVSCLK
jgi:hypothetical protein